MTLHERWNADDEIFLRSLIKKRLFLMLIGSIVGDALGVPVEFRARDPSIQGMTGYGTHHQPPGTWSDDTSLTLHLMKNILKEGNEDALMPKFADCRDHGYLTPFGEMFDIGGATCAAIDRYKLGTPATLCGGRSEFDNGNGALMRIAPLVGILWSEKEFITRQDTIEKIAKITHAHPRSNLGCIIFVDFLIGIFCNNSPEVALQDTINNSTTHFSTSSSEYIQELKHYDRILSKSIISLERSAIKSEGYVVHSLEAAI